MHRGATIAADWGRAIVDFALPPRCPACGTVVDRDHSFCLDCWQGFDHLDAGCPRCGDPSIPFADPDLLCGACLAEPPPFDTMRAAVAYGDEARAIALKLKYGGRTGLARTIARALRRHMEGLDDALIVPVPLHRWRIWRRGFNQAALIARALAGRDRDRLRVDTLQRTRPTPPLRAMSRTERDKTVRGAFALPDEKRPDIEGRAVVLVDDVYTSGATVRACAKMLKKKGADAVHVRCWARVVRTEEDGY